MIERLTAILALAFAVYTIAGVGLTRFIAPQPPAPPVTEYNIYLPFGFVEWQQER